MSSIKSFSNKITNKSSQYADVMMACRTLLQHEPKAAPIKQYLKERLGSDLLFENGFGFGWFPPNEHINLLTNYVNEDILIKLNLAYKKSIEEDGIQKQILHGILSQHNLIMPYKDLYGNIVSIVGRSLLPKETMDEQNIPKYKNTKFEKSFNLFGLNLAKDYIVKNNKAIVVEGQFDCITCHRHGYKNVVALGGISLTKFQIYLLLRFTDNIVLMLDNDPPGRKATEKIIRRYSDIANIYSFEWFDKKEKDADELLKSGYNLNTI